MSSILAPFVIAFVLAISLVPLCRRAAFRVGVVARPREDRWHREATPLFGGAAICLAVFIVLLGFGRLDEVAVLAIAGAAIFIVGLTDDILKTPHSFAGGHISVPAGPGLGIEVDEAKVRRYARET